MSLGKDMNHCFVVTPLLDEDYSAWQPLFYEYITWNKASIPVQQYRRTFDRIIDPSSELDALVARDGSDRQKIIGIAQFYPHQNTWMEEKVMHLSDLFVVPEMRRKGIGKQLINAVANEAKQRGCVRLQWVTQEDNPARGLYDQLATSGFTRYKMKLDG